MKQYRYKFDVWLSGGVRKERCVYASGFQAAVRELMKVEPDALRVALSVIQ